MFNQSGNINGNAFGSNGYLDQNASANGNTMAPPSSMPNDANAPSLYRRPTQEEISAVLSQYATGPSQNNGQMRPPMLAHPSQMSMQSQPSGGMEGDAAQRAAASQMVQQGMNLDPAAAAAAAAAYGHLGYGPAPGSMEPRRQQSLGDPKTMMGGPGHGQMQEMMSDIGQISGMQVQGGPGGPSDPMQQMGGFVPQGYPGHKLEDAGAGAGGPAGNDDFGPGKKRRMTFGGQFQAAQMSPPKPGMMPRDGSVSMAHDYSSLGSTLVNHQMGPDGSQHHMPSRPPLLHRRSRSGSELAGNMPGFRGPMSFDGFPEGHSFGVLGPTAPVFLSSHSHQASFTRGGALPPSALGGHAASHPPGLGSQILRGVDVSASGSSAASDFTKRKGWTGRVVEELLDFVHVLDPDGVILFASPSAYSLTGWTSEELRGRKLTEFIHPQDVASVEREIERIRSSNGELLTYYRFKTKPKAFSSGGNDKASSSESTAAADDKDDKDHTKGNPEYAEAFTRDGEYVVFEASGHPYFPPKPPTVPSNGAQADSEGDAAPEDNKEAGASEGAEDAAKGDGFKAESMTNTASGSKQGSHSLSQSHPLDTPSEASSQHRGPLQCFFCSARPYPSKNTSMLDSFLELKLENEKLRLLIADMDLTGPDNDAEKANFTAAYHPDLLKQELESDGFGGPLRDGINPMFGSAAMHQQGQDVRFGNTPFGNKPGGGAARQNSLGSHPTSPTVRSGAAQDLFDNVVGIGNESDEDATSPNTAHGSQVPGSQGTAEEARRKKKPKQDDGDHVCTDCGRVDSPEWRKGPLGPKTLCNACGLRWAKKIKRKGGDPAMAGMMVQPPGAPQQLLGHGHPLQHSFGRAPDGSIQPMGMPPPGAINMAGMGVGQPGMMQPTSPIFATRPSFDESQGHMHGQGP